MICLLESTGKLVKTNEEYALLLKKKIKLLYWILVIGIFTAIIAICNESFGFIEGTSWINGVYTGTGTGFAVVAALKIRQLNKTIRDESLLKEKRLSSQDERNRMILTKAFESSAITVLIISYVTMMIAGFFSRTVFYCFWFVILLFAIIFFIFNKYYNRKL